LPRRVLGDMLGHQPSESPRPASSQFSSCHSREPRVNRHYLVTTIHDCRTDQLVLTREERAGLRPDAVGVQIDEPKQLISIKHPGSEEIATYRIGKTRGFGVYEWDLLTDIVFSAGDFVELESARHVNQRVRRIRRLFGDSKDLESFFVTTLMPYGIALNPARTFRYIEILAEAPEQTVESRCA
jgi:hypothetical protein